MSDTIDNPLHPTLKELFSRLNKLNGLYLHLKLENEQFRDLIQESVDQKRWRNSYKDGVGIAYPGFD